MGRPLRSSAARAAGQHGSVMLEALVSIVVTSLAMLASAALAINASKVNQTGRYRGQAILLVNDVAERISANPVTAATGVYALTAGSGQPDPNDVAAASDCSAGACSPTAYAQSDMLAWRSKLVSQLPQATAQLAFTAAAGTTPAQYVVTVNWVERSIGHGGTARTNGGTVSDSENFAYTTTVVVPPR